LYSALRENTANALNETQCHTNRCVFKSRRNWSGPTAGSRTAVHGLTTLGWGIYDSLCYFVALWLVGGGYWRQSADERLGDPPPKGASRIL